MAAVRHPGGMSDDFRPGGTSYDFRLGIMSYVTHHKADVCVSKREEATWQFLGRIPQCPLLYRMSDLVRKGGIKNVYLYKISLSLVVLL